MRSGNNTRIEKDAGKNTDFIVLNSPKEAVAKEIIEYIFQGK
jgi:hypothetical protein